MPVETLTYTYTSEDEIKRLASVSGVNLRTSDLVGSNTTDYWTELVADATDIVNQYVLGLYEEIDLADNRWVRTRASWIGLTQLCRRRGNPVPDSVLQRYEEIIEELLQVRDGFMQIPRLPTRADIVPVMSNLRVDDRYLSRKLRVNPNISTGQISGQQDIDYFWTYDWI
jgi:hypothetical protein